MRRPLGLVAALAAGFSIAAPAALASPQRPAGPPGSAGRATAGPARFGIRLVDVPVSEGDNGRAWLYIIDFLHPGTVIHRRVAVVNDSAKAAVVQVYPGPASIAHGEFIGGAAQASNDLTTWTSVSHPVLMLAPWATAMDMVTIRVPRDAWQGERYGAIWAQETTRDQATSRAQYAEINRVGVRMYLDVGPGGPPRTTFAITSVIGWLTPQGLPEVIAGVRDTGARAIDVHGTLMLGRGPGGFSAGPITFQRILTLAPGQSGQMIALLSKMTPAGSWQATVTMQSGDTAVQAQATIQLGAIQTAAFTLSRPLLLGLIIAILALAIGLWARRLRRARRLQPPQPDA